MNLPDPRGNARSRASYDERRGRAPDIRSDGESVIFRIAVAGMASDVRLLIRCDADGEVCLSIAQGHGGNGPHQPRVPPA